MLTVIEAAASHDLTSLDAVKAELGIADAADDALLAGMIGQASAAVARHCGRVFARETVEETLRLDGHATRAVALTRYPVRELQSVTHDGVVLAAEAVNLDGPRGLLFSEAGAWTGRLRLRYIAGWRLPEAGTDRDLPADVERACLDTVKAAWHARLRDPALALLSGHRTRRL